MVWVRVHLLCQHAFQIDLFVFQLPLSTTDDSPPVVSTASKLAHEEFLKDDRLFIAQKSLNRTNRPCKRARHHKTCHHGASCGQKLDDNDASEDEIYTSSDSQTSGDENSRKAQVRRQRLCKLPDSQVLGIDFALPALPQLRAYF